MSPGRSGRSRSALACDAEGRPASAPAARPWSRSGVALLAGLGLLALVLPVRSARQLAYEASFAVALGTMWLWGRAFARAALGVRSPGPCTAVYLGQFALMAAGSVGMALNGAAAALLGRSLPLVALVVPPTLALLVREARGTARAPSGEAPRPDLLALLALGSVAVVVAIYSRHLSALGLDTHQHTAWARQIAAAGHVALAEPHTRILAGYPRTFHALVALWNAAGLAPPIGPFLKATPFLQSALPVLSLGELLLRATAAGGGARARLRWELAVGIAFFAYAFLIVPMVYPTWDLSGTPRFSSGGLLLLPVILVAVSAVHGASGAASLAWGVLPLVGAWAVTWNPVVLVLLVTATVPLLVALWVAWKTERPPARRRGWAIALAASCALGATTLVQDPWVLSQAAVRSPAIAALLDRAGLVEFGEALRRGLVSERGIEAYAPRRAAPACRSPRCVGDVATRVAVEALSVPVRAARTAWADLRQLARSPSVATSRDAFKGALPVPPSPLADHAALPWALVVAGGSLAAAGRALRRRRQPGTRRATAAERLLAASVVGLGVATIGTQFTAGMAGALNDHSHEGEILAGYLAGAGGHAAVVLLWLPFVAACVVLAEPHLGRAAAPDPAARVPALRPRVLRGLGLAAWLALPLLARLNLERPTKHRGFWSQIGFGDLRALRRVEAAIPPSEAVLIPAEHWNISDWEHWVIPVGQTTALLPYGDRKYLFNVYLGAAYPYSWRDLQDRLCSSDRATRVRFLQASGARWALVRDRNARDAREALRDARICRQPLEAFGAVLPAARAENGIYLFRLAEG